MAETLQNISAATPDGTSYQFFTPQLAAEYSAANTYALGDYCVRQGQLYRCTTAIPTAEAWNAAHWTAVYIADEITTVDSALSSTSENPVQNRAIAGQLEYTNEFAYSGISLDNIGLTIGHYIHATTGALVSSGDHWSSDLIPVLPGMSFEYRLAGYYNANTGAAALIMGFSADGTTPVAGSSVLSSGQNTAVYGTYTVPSGVSFIRVCTSKWDDDASSPNGKVFGVFIRLAGTIDASQYFPRLSDFPWVDNRIIPENGYTIATGGGDAYKATVDYIKVTEGDTIEYALPQTVDWTIIAFYDKFKNLVSRPVVGAGGNYAGVKSGTLTVPSGVEYVRFSFNIPSDLSATSYLALAIYGDPREKINQENASAIRTISAAKKYDFVADVNSTLIRPLTLCHFSDIHGTEDNLARLVDFVESNSLTLLLKDHEFLL